MNLEVLLINAVWFVTVWLAIPGLAALCLRHRAPEAQRMLLRFVLATLPVMALVGFVSSYADVRPAVFTWSDQSLASAPISALDPEAPEVERTEAAATLPRNGETAPSEPAAPELLATLLHESVEEPRSSALPQAPPAEVPSEDFVSSAEALAAAPSPEVHPENPAELAVQPQRIAAESSSAHPMTLLGLSVWAFVASLGLLGWLLQHRAVRQERQRWLELPATCARHAQHLARDMGLRRSWSLCGAPHLSEPVAVGFVKPTIALPQDWSEEVPRGGLDSFLRHEIAHLRGRDPLWRSLATLTARLLWFHPLTHWLLRREGVLSEFVADRAVLGQGTPAREYAQMLGNFASSQIHGPAPIPFAAPILGRRRPLLEGRLRMILKGRLVTRTRDRITRLSLLTLAGITFAGLLSQPLVSAATGGSDVLVEAMQVRGWWTVRGTTDEGELCWSVRLCSENEIERMELSADNNKVHVRCDGRTWTIDRETGQTQSVRVHGNHSTSHFTVLDPHSRENEARARRQLAELQERVNLNRANEETMRALELARVKELATARTLVELERELAVTADEEATTLTRLKADLDRQMSLLQSQAERQLDTLHQQRDRKIAKAHRTHERAAQEAHRELELAHKKLEQAIRRNPDGSDEIERLKEQLEEDQERLHQHQEEVEEHIEDLIHDFHEHVTEQERHLHDEMTELREEYEDRIDAERNRFHKTRKQLEEGLLKMRIDREFEKREANERSTLERERRLKDEELWAEIKAAKEAQHAKLKAAEAANWAQLKAAEAAERERQLDREARAKAEATLSASDLKAVVQEMRALREQMHLLKTEVEDEREALRREIESLRKQREQ